MQPGIVVLFGLILLVSLQTGNVESAPLGELFDLELPSTVAGLSYSDLYKLLNKFVGINYMINKDLKADSIVDLEEMRKKMPEKLFVIEALEKWAQKLSPADKEQAERDIEMLRVLLKKIKPILKSTSVIDLYRYLHAFRFSLARKCLVEFEANQDAYIDWYKVFRTRHPTFTKVAKEAHLYKVAYQDCVHSLSDSQRNLAILDESAAQASVIKTLEPKAEHEKKFKTIREVATQTRKFMEKLAKNAIKNATDQAIRLVEAMSDEEIVPSISPVEVVKSESKNPDNVKKVKEGMESALAALKNTMKSAKTLSRGILKKLYSHARDEEEKVAQNGATFRLETMQIESLNTINAEDGTDEREQLRNAIYETIQAMFDTRKANLLANNGDGHSAWPEEPAKRRDLLIKLMLLSGLSMLKDLRFAIKTAVLDEMKSVILSGSKKLVATAVKSAKHQSAQIAAKFFDWIKLVNPEKENSKSAEKSLVNDAEWNLEQNIEFEMKLYMTNIIAVNGHSLPISKDFRHPALIVDGTEIDFSYRGVRLAEAGKLTYNQAKETYHLPAMKLSYAQIQQVLDGLAREQNGTGNRAKYRSVRGGFTYRTNNYIHNNCNRFMELLLKGLVAETKQNEVEGDEIGESNTVEAGSPGFADLWPKKLKRKWFVKLLQGPLRPVSVPIVEIQLDHNLFLHTLANEVDHGLEGGERKNGVVEWDEEEGIGGPTLDQIVAQKACSRKSTLGKLGSKLASPIRNIMSPSPKKHQ